MNNPWLIPRSRGHINAFFFKSRQKSLRSRIFWQCMHNILRPHNRNKVYDYTSGGSRLANVEVGYSYIITLLDRGDINILLLHLVTFCNNGTHRLLRFCGSVTSLPHVRLKVTPGDDIQLLIPIHFNVFL